MHLPITTPTENIRKMRFVAKKLMAQPIDAIMAPAIVVVRQPKRSVMALAIGPKQ